MPAYAPRIPTTLAQMCRPERCCLLVYDMQGGVVRQVADGAGVTERVGVLLEAARMAGVRVAYTRHMSLPKAWMGMFQTRMAMAWQRTDDPGAVQPWFLPGSDAFAIVPELAPRADEPVFDKLAMSAFEGTPLPFAMRDMGLDVVILAGIAMEIGIEPTARHAADLGLIPVVVKDACGFGHAQACARAFDALDFAGDAVLTDLSAVKAALAG